MLNLATVGTSEITKKFLSGCRLTNRFTLHTAYSRDRERGNTFAESEGFIKSSDDIYELAKDPCVDAVYIATPNAFHYKQSKLFLENGKHVICEKPIATSLSEYKELFSLAREKGLIYMDAIMGPHYKGHKILHEALSEIGDVAQARIDFCQRSNRLDSLMAGEMVNIFDMSLHAGTFMDLGVYCVYMAVDLFGMLIDITASSSFFKNGADNSGSAILTYKDFVATLTYSKAAQSAIASEIIGDAGAVKITSISQYAGISLVKDGKVKILFEIPPKDQIMSGEAEKFANYIENFDKFKDDYKAKSLLTENVMQCMDIIKQKANLKYK